MNGIALLLIFLAGLILLVIILGIRIVPQGSKYVIERLGKYYTTLEPGPNIIIPVVDRVARMVSTKDIVLDIHQQEAITKDNVVIGANAVAYINISRPEKATYGVEDYTLAITNLVQTSLRSIIGEMNLDDVLSSREEIKVKLRAGISDDISRDWGITLKTVEIQDIKIPETMQKAMEEQAAAERARRAAVSRAGGEKSAAILEAEGRLEASKLEAQAKVLLANANQQAIQKVSEAIQSNELPVMFLLGEKYVDAIKGLSTSANSKVVVLPADIPAALRGIFSTLRHDEQNNRRE
jgi:regulator of protease activity HflC (stomatin/prohibitin superfamily)